MATLDLWGLYGHQRPRCSFSVVQEQQGARDAYCLRGFKGWVILANKIGCTDQDDEAMKRYKASLGIGVGNYVSDPNDPRQCIIKSLALVRPRSSLRANPLPSSEDMSRRRESLTCSTGSVRPP